MGFTFLSGLEAHYFWNRNLCRKYEIDRILRAHTGYGGIVLFLCFNSVPMLTGHPYLEFTGIESGLAALPICIAVCHFKTLDIVISNLCLKSFFFSQLNFTLKICLHLSLT